MRSGLLLIAILSSGATAALAAEPNPYLEQGRSLYESVQYEKCVERLDEAALVESSFEEQVQIQIYAGLCDFSLGRLEDADAHFRRALTLNRSIGLPPFTSPKATERFARIRESLPPEPVTPKLDDPKVPASTPGVTLSNPANPTVEDAPAKSRGVRVLPIVFGSVAIASAGAGTGFYVRAKSFEARANAEPFESTAIELGDQARTQMSLAQAGYGVAAVAATTALILWLLED